MPPEEPLEQFEFAPLESDEADASLTAKSVEQDSSEAPGILRHGLVNSVLCFIFFTANVAISIVSLFRLPINDPLGNSNNNRSDSESYNESNYKGATVSVSVLLISALALGWLAERARLPGLLGMLIAGIVLNIPGTPLFCPAEWSKVLRQLAFIVILLRGGLSLDAKALAKMKGACIRLALLPCSFEAIAVMAAACLIFSMSIPFGLTLGAVLAAVSPAVVVPAMLEAAEKGYGRRKGIPTLVIAASSIDDVYAIALFYVFLSIAFSTGGSILLTLLKVPIEVGLGIVMGGIGGFVLRFLPSSEVQERIVVRIALLVSLSTAFFFGAAYAGVESSGPIAVLVCAFVAANGWQESATEQQTFAVLWSYFFQPLLFALIGFKLSFTMLSVRLVLFGLLVLIVGLSVRLLAAITAVSWTDLNKKERLFVAFAWLPKATVQAALAPVAFDMCTALSSPDDVIASTQIFAVAVLSILTTAPVGAFLIRMLAPRLLVRDDSDGGDTKDVEQ